MLDDLKYIHQKDSQDALGVAGKQPSQLTHNFNISFKSLLPIENVVVAGMGGSALAASFIDSWPALTVPFTVIRDYNLPSYVSKNTLFVASSYSGNTEETLAALEQAEKKQPIICTISSGGILARQASKKQHIHIKMPEGLQPRMAVFYNFAALVELFEAARLIPAGSKDELKSVATFLLGKAKEWQPDVPTNKNLAKQLALDLLGSSPVIYAAHTLFPAAYKWKININENAKNVAWAGRYPEFNHNEFVGWSSHPVSKPYKVINLRCSFDGKRINERFDLSKRLLGGRMPDPIEIKAEGSSLIEQLFWTVLLGDYVSIYLAIVNGLNPTPVELIEKLKRELQHP